MTTYTLPTIHLNGTGARVLAEEYDAAWMALKTARAAFIDTTMNARDFYPQGDHAFHDARFERSEAIAKLDDVIDYVESWLAHINDHRKDHD